MLRPPRPAVRKFWRVADYFRDAGRPWNYWSVRMRRDCSLVDGERIWPASLQLAASTASRRDGLELWSLVSSYCRPHPDVDSSAWRRTLRSLFRGTGYSGRWHTFENEPSVTFAKRVRRVGDLSREAKWLEEKLPSTSPRAKPGPRPNRTRNSLAGACATFRALDSAWAPFISGYERREKFVVDARRWTACFKLHVYLDEPLPGEALPRFQASATIWPPELSAQESARLLRTKTCTTMRRALLDAGFDGRWKDAADVGLWGDFWKNHSTVREVREEAGRLLTLRLQPPT